jgi:hypothetical protein
MCLSGPVSGHRGEGCRTALAYAIRAPSATRTSQRDEARCLTSVLNGGTSEARHVSRRLSKHPIAFSDAMRDPYLLADGFGDLSSWKTWAVALKGHLR